MALRVFKGSYKGIRQEVLIPDAVRARLDKFYRWKQTQRRPECTADDAPLFVSREGGRLSDRQLRTAFARWQERAGIERHYRVHDLRHTSGTNFYRLTKNIVMTKIHMRHASIESTMIYMHVCDEEMIRAAQDMPN